jgi:hypothetical protein
MPPARRTPPKVLRVAVICDDLICDELHQVRQGSVTVGSHYGSTLMVFGAATPRRHRLFEFRGGRYYLDLPPQARGKIALGRKRFTVNQLRKRFGTRDFLRIQLNAEAKGKLVFGETTLLFQFDNPKPVPKKAPFPAEFKPVIANFINKTEAASLAAAALLLGSYFIWAATRDVVLFAPGEIDDRFAKVMGLYNEDEDEEPPEEEAAEEMLAQEEEEEEKKEEEEIDISELVEKPNKYSAEAIKEARGVGIARVLGTYGGPGDGTVFDVIQSTDNNLGDLFDLGMTTTIMADGGDISPFVPGGKGVDQYGGTVGTKGLETKEGPDVEKTQKKEKKVRGKAKQSGGTDIFGDVDKKAVKATIRRRISALQYCYEKALRTNPTLGGKMTYTINISVMGSVTRVDIEEDTVGNAGVTACTKGKIKGWRFPVQGAEDPAEVTFSVVFSGST